ncbi:chloride channel protein [Rhodopila globiformis]|uniref:Chloride channel protein n=1 Tax=Rhodopila globiformis TaxID=1071 RepID=A0A2S6MXI2_RHOGL|nr:chloride channel protein [Rhodopila globiformis]PPQ27058.1 chloride channel protein [Rhodopila globiformis]
MDGESTIADADEIRGAGQTASAADRAAARRSRRPFGSAVLHAPQVLRALVRTDEIWLVVLAAFIGCATGLSVWLMTTTTQMVHQVLFGIGHDERLSAMAVLDPFRTVLVPAFGGLAMGLATLGFTRLRPRRTVDPIEANALFGGRMSLSGSLIVVIQTIMSNGVGASVGLEAGYTQIGSAMASRVGHAFRVRRNDMRLLVGCGAAAAIAGAFNAPLTGSFYAFELIIGTYTLVSFAPVSVAALVSQAVVQALGGSIFDLNPQVMPHIEALDYIPILALGMLCALLGISIMRGVTITEELFRKSGVPAWMRPGIGGLAIGLLSLVTPAVLSSGHGALGMSFEVREPLRWVVLLVLLKATASAISIGSGFRGGLFFASLFLGALLGKAFAGALIQVSSAHAVPATVCELVGMSGLAVAIIGGPLTMGFLALEATGSLPMTVAVLAACVVSSLTVRRTFGYSFATWRFHLRGEAIRSAVDIGWMRNLTVGRMMRREMRTVRADTPLSVFKRDFPLGAAQRVIVLDEGDRYAGIVLLPEAHADADDERKVRDVVHYAETVLLPQMTIKEAVAMFENAESDALVVVDSAEGRHVIGLLTEQYALRRYSEELDRRRRELSGE